MISAVTESAFAGRRRSDWDALEDLVMRAKRVGLRKLAPEDVARISPLYRDLCADLARAQAACYSAPLVDYLQALTTATHTLVYGRGTPMERRAARERAPRAFAAFPRAVRAHKWAMILAALLFFVPFAAALLAALHDPAFAFRVVPEGMLKPLAEAYAKGFSAGRGEGEGVMMAGFYVNNNVGIALRTFALGIFGGVGSAFFLVQNGLTIGAVFGYVASQGAGANILTFVVGHGSFELGAIVLAGGAGLALGWSFIAPGERTRVASLQAVAKDVLIIVAGAAVMLLFAAAIEAFWSGSSLPAATKRTVGAVFFVLVVLYLALGGRSFARRAGAS